MKRAYYDHEPAYQRIQAAGGTGWDDLFPDQTNVSYRDLEQFLASPLAPAGGRALDLGCGGGQAARMLAARGYHVTGIELSPTAIALARAHTSEPSVEYIEGDCLDLAGLRDFDLVIDNHVLHCILGADRARFLGEVVRALRPGGVFFSTTMSREGDLDLAQLGVDPATYLSTRGNRYWTSRAELDHEIERAGFEIMHRDERVAGPGEGIDLIRVARKR